MSRQSKAGIPAAPLKGEDSVPPVAESSQLRGLQDEITELKRIIMQVTKARDQYRDDFFRVDKAYLDFKYPAARPRSEKAQVSCTQIVSHLRAHTEAISELIKMVSKFDGAVAYDPTGKTREPPHCPTCACGVNKAKTYER